MITSSTPTLQQLYMGHIKDKELSVRCLVFPSDLNRSRYPYLLTINIAGKADIDQLTNTISKALNKHFKLNISNIDRMLTGYLRLNIENKYKLIIPSEIKRLCFNFWDDGLSIFSNENLLACRVLHNKFGKYWSSQRPIWKVFKKNNDLSSFLYIYQVLSTTIAKRKEQNLVQVRMNFCYLLNELY